VNPEQLVAHLRKLASTLTAGQIAALAGVFLAVVLVVAGSAYWINAPQYTLLVSDMDAETSASVVGMLKDNDVPYQLADGGRTVRVPVERADELRLQLASGGLPSEGRIGFEIFDRPAFGTTEFLEHVNYRRALEGELARTIGTLSEVSSARVHIAMAKDSLFIDRDQPAKASVVLKLKANRPLSPDTARGIAGLVSGSVESLRPESVVILDTFGRSLTRPEDTASAGGLSGQQFERQQQIERTLETQVVSLLEPVVGAGRVRVNVSAQLRADLVEETEESYDPSAVVRSRQTSTETGASPAVVGGVAGARANQPPALSTSNANPASGTPAAPATPPGAPGRQSETTNYEVSRRTRHTVSPQGQLSRLSVAVVLDDEQVVAQGQDGTSSTTTKAWAPDQIERFQKLVAAAVGLDPARGDVITVDNIAFESPVAAPEPAAPGFGGQFMTGVQRYWPTALRYVLVLAVAAYALFGILRPMSRRVTTMTVATAPAGGGARLPTVQEMEGQVDADAGRGGPARPPALGKRVAKLADEEPEQLVRIVRGWMSEEQR
jgi:flagellar M-ring protein FliF